MRKWTLALLPAVMMATGLPAQAQGNEPARANAPVAGKAAAAKATPANASAKAAADRKRQFTAGAAPAAVAATQSTSPVASPAAPALTKDKSHCHSSGSDA
jgi:hypothetical protein